MQINRFTGLSLVILSVTAFAFAGPPEGKKGRGPGGPPQGHRGDGPRGGHHGRPPMGPPAILKAIDANGDQKISKEEMESAAAALKKLDKNGDGVLTPDEFAFPGHGGAPHGKEGHHRGPGGPPRDGAGRGRGPGRGPADGRRGDAPHGDKKHGERGHHGPPRGPGGPGGFGDRFKEVDKNGDGKVSKEEAVARVSEMFDKVDANGDGQIEQSEIRSFMEKMHKSHGHRRGHHGPPGDKKSDDHDHKHDPPSDKK